MSLVNLIKNPLKRLMPHRGLFINVDVWSAAHEYHRRQQRLHSLSMHRPGVAVGLEVLANSPPDNSVLVDRGIAVDSDGNMILFPEPERYRLQTDHAGVVYLVLRYDETSDENNRETDATLGKEYQPLFAVERGIVEVRGQLPSESYVELARIELSGTGNIVNEPQDPVCPGLDEVDYRSRTVSGLRPLGEIGIGLIDLSDGSADRPRHLSGAGRLVQAINATTAYHAEFRGTFDLREEIAGCHLLLVAGQQSFSLTDDQLSIIGHFLARKGTLWAESCGAGLDRINEAVPFLHAVEAMVGSLQRNLGFVERSHPLFNSHYLFAEPPNGVEGATQILFSDGIFYSNGDYGCLWNGGRPERSAPRPDIRSATELGINLGVYSLRRIHTLLS